MSAPAFAWALERGATLALRPSDRLVLLYLADMANGLKVCWPGQPLIERYTGLKNNTVRAAINRLAALQLIRVEGTPGKLTRYHILRPDTPANGDGGNPRKRAQGHPRKRDWGTPSKRHRAPPQLRGWTPSKRCPDPRKRAHRPFKYPRRRP